MNRPTFAHLTNPSPARAIGVVSCAVALTAMVACTQTLNMEAVKASISAGIGTRLELPIAGVTCPERREVKASDTFECTVQPQGGGRLVVKVTQKDDKSNIEWEVVKTEGLLDLEGLATQIKDGLKEQAGLDVTVSCGAKFRPTEPGKNFECTATDTEGAKAQVTVTVKDMDGNVSWNLGK